jgi:GNAT superfamily N-acetyltransferase
MGVRHDRRMNHDLPELMTVWVRGWTISRESPAPIEIPGGFRVDLRRPTPGVRYVLHTYDVAALRRLGREPAVPGTGIKIIGNEAALRAALPDTWATHGAGYLMTTTFRPGTATPVAPYTTRIALEGRTHVVHILDADGEIAAAAHLAPSGAYGVVDRVWTRAEHQRRGLGTVMMQLLADRAVEVGLTTGVLSGSEEGRALYLALGWTVRSDLASAFRTAA